MCVCMCVCVCVCVRVAASSGHPCLRHKRERSSKASSTAVVSTGGRADSCAGPHGERK